MSYYLRDWMHITVSGGCANVECGLLLDELKRHRVPVRLLKDSAICVYIYIYMYIYIQIYIYIYIYVYI